MQKVEHISDFPKGSYVQQFFGKSYDDAVSNANKAGNFLKYYEQIHYGKSKSILVSYNKENEDE